MYSNNCEVLVSYILACLVKNVDKQNLVVVSTDWHNDL